MPFYEYECANCKFYKEVMQRVSDAPLKKCPSCGKNALKKLLSAPVFRLKGAGWYETDFKSDKEAKRNLAEKEPEPEKKKEAAAESKDAKTEAKPAEKAVEGNATDAKSADSKPTPSKSASDSKAPSESAGSRRSTRTIRRSTTRTSSKGSAKAKKTASRKHR